MYLANDVIQNSKKKGPEYGKQFGTVLRKAFEIMGGDACSDKTQKSLSRLLKIWEERGVYSKELIDEFKSALGSTLLLFIFSFVRCFFLFMVNKYSFPFLIVSFLLHCVVHLILLIL